MFIRRIGTLLALLFTISVSARAQIGMRTYTTTVVANDVGLGNLGSGIAYHQLTWNVVGSVPTCAVKLQQSPDNSTWSDLIANQTCTANGQSAVTNVIANYVRINVTTKSGAGSIVVHWNGFNTDPAVGGNISGTIGATQIAFGTGIDLIGGSNLFTFTLATPNTSFALLNASPCSLTQISQALFCSDGTNPALAPQVEIIGGSNVVNHNPALCMTHQNAPGNTGSTRGSTACWFAQPNDGGGLTFTQNGRTGGGIDWIGVGGGNLTGALEVGVFGIVDPTLITQFQFIPDGPVNLVAPDVLDLIQFVGKNGAATKIADIGINNSTGDADFEAFDSLGTNDLQLVLETTTGIAKMYSGAVVLSQYWDAAGNSKFFHDIELASDNLAISSTAPTVSSGFGTGASITANNGTLAFRVGIGTSNTGTGVIGLPTAATGWNCYATNITNKNANQAQVLQTASTTASATFQNYTDVMGTHVMTDNDVLAISCFAY